MTRDLEKAMADLMSLLPEPQEEIAALKIEDTKRFFPDLEAPLTPYDPESQLYIPNEERDEGRVSRSPPSSQPYGLSFRDETGGGVARVGRTSRVAARAIVRNDGDLDAASVKVEFFAELIGSFSEVDGAVFDVEDVFSISGRGTVVTGKMRHGSFDFLQTIKTSDGAEFTITAIEGRSGTTFQEVSPETGSVGLILRGASTDDLRGVTMLHDGQSVADSSEAQAALTVSGATYLGMATLDVPRGTERDVEFDLSDVQRFLPVSAPENKRGSATVLIHARAYAFSTNDMPEDLDSLDAGKEWHVMSRSFVIDWAGPF